MPETSAPEPNPVPGIDATGDFDEAEDLAREIRSIDGFPYMRLPAVERAETVARRTVLVQRLTWVLLQGVPLP